MKLVRTMALVAAALLWGAAPSHAAGEQDRIFEFSPLAGFFLPDENTFYSSSSPLVGFRATLNNSSRWGLEGVLGLSFGQTQTFRTGRLDSYNFQVAYNNADQPVGFVFTDLQTTESTAEANTSLFLAGGNVIFHLTESKLRPFLTAGVGFIDDRSSGVDAPPSPFSNSYFDLGVGLKYERRNSFGVRLDVKDLVMNRDDLPQADARAALLAAQRDLLTGGGDDGQFGAEPYSPDSYRGRRWLNNYSVSLSLTFPMGFAWADGDGDMIEDRFDESPTTPPGVVVDPLGRGLDTDQDGVLDGLDQCADTPLGATVDLQGCPSDTDGDGVLDGLDQCADTPVGALVSAQGCPSDTDGDGVLDGLDACNETPLGAAIDDKGCVKNPVEAQLLRRELITMENVDFEPGAPEVRPLSYHYINKMGRLLERWTGHEEYPLRIEIGVHTDGVGSEVFNLDLSQRRAETIRTYLLESFPGMGQNNLVALGYGESLPVADNDTEEGRAANRRVEIRVTGEGDTPELYESLGDLNSLDLDNLLPDLDLPDAPGLDLPDAPELPDAPDLPDFPDEPELPDFDDDDGGE